MIFEPPGSQGCSLEQRLFQRWTWKQEPSLGQTREQQPSLGLTRDLRPSQGRTWEQQPSLGWTRGQGPFSGLDSGTEAFSGTNAGTGALSRLWSGARAHSLFLLNLLLWAAVKEIAAVIIGLGSESASGLETGLVLDQGRTLSRHRRIPSLQHSPVVSGRSTGRW